METKTTKMQDATQLIHRIPAGAMPMDKSIELFADRESKKVYFMSHGVTYPFEMLSGNIKMALFKELQKDRVAFETLKHLPYSEGLERYVYCVYGTLDHKADICQNGVIGGSDNFLCGIPGCNCTDWESKNIDYKGKVIKGRLLEVLIAFRKGRDDKNVAAELGIEMSTLNAHKKKLFEILAFTAKLKWS